MSVNKSRCWFGKSLARRQPHTPHGEAISRSAGTEPTSEPFRFRSNTVFRVVVLRVAVVAAIGAAIGAVLTAWQTPARRA